MVQEQRRGGRANDPQRDGPVDLLVTGIGQLCTLARDGGAADGPRRGPSLAEIGLVEDAALAVADGRVVACGPASSLAGLDARAGYDAGGACVLPGLVDPHTHAVYGRTRQDEYERRLRGETYLEIAAAGGGIHASVRDLRARGEDDLVALTVPRLREALASGTTTLEIKSGYGLSPDDEVKMLRAARRAADEAGLRAVLTCLAAHEIPAEYRDRRSDYVDLVCEEILPRVAEEGLAERLDVFCEPTVFDLAETERILARGLELGLRATVHADELEPFGGAALAARLGAGSADHLIRIDDAGIAALAGAETVAVLLPGTVFTLGLRDYAPARDMIEAGVAISSLPLVMAIACTQMKMSPAEALTASTVNAACALGLGDEAGQLAPGRPADFLVLDVDDYRLVPYHAGRNPVRAVFRDGERVV